MRRPDPRVHLRLEQEEGEPVVGRVGSDGVDTARREAALGDEGAAAHFRDADEGLLAGLAVDVGEARVPVLEPAHLAELLFHAPAHLHGDGEVLLELLLLHVRRRDAGA